MGSTRNKSKRLGARSMKPADKVREDKNAKRRAYYQARKAKKAPVEFHYDT